jgi:hypothetical protein
MTSTDTDTSTNIVKTRRSARYWIRLAVIAIVIVMLLMLITPVAAGIVGMWALTHPYCADSGVKPSLPYRDIVIPSATGSAFHGYFISGTKPAIVIVPPAYAGGRSGMLAEASLIAADGFSVLLYESRLCAGRAYTSLGYQEVDDVGDVLTYLKTNPDSLPVNIEHIALHGFSSAGATSTMAAMRYPEISAVLAEGNYQSMDDLIGYTQGDDLSATLVKFGARIGYRLITGNDLSVLNPQDALFQIPPRPIYLVYGTQENVAGIQTLMASVKRQFPDAQIELWQVPNAWHGGYIAAVGGAEYSAHVIPFYNCSLLKQCEAWTQLWPK